MYRFSSTVSFDCKPKVYGPLVTAIVSSLHLRLISYIPGIKRKINSLKIHVGIFKVIFKFVPQNFDVNMCTGFSNLATRCHNKQSTF